MTKAFREALDFFGMTPTRLARLSGLSLDTVKTAMYRGGQPTIRTAVMIATGLARANGELHRDGRDTYPSRLLTVEKLFWGASQNTKNNIGQGKGKNKGGRAA